MAELDDRERGYEELRRRMTAPDAETKQSIDMNRARRIGDTIERKKGGPVKKRQFGGPVDPRTMANPAAAQGLARAALGGAGRLTPTLPPQAMARMRKKGGPVESAAHERKEKKLVGQLARLERSEPKDRGEPRYPKKANSYVR
jgi:hypothetical protein